MGNNEKLWLSIVALLTIWGVAGLILLSGGANVLNLGGAQPGTGALFASSSIIQVGPSVNGTVIFNTAATSTCSARFISTLAQPINLYFATDSINDLVFPRELLGFQQAASTTVVYDAATWGCGKVKAFGFAATTTITLGRSE